MTSEGPDAPEATSRRAFIQRAASTAVALAGGGLAAACTGGSDDAAAVDPTPEVIGGDTALPPGPLLLRNAFPDGLQAPTIIGDTGMQRAIFALSRDAEILQADELPDTFAATLSTPAERREVTLNVRTAQIPRHYVSLEFEPFGAELYNLSFAVEGETVQTQFVVAPLADVPLVHPGDPMPALDTPTALDGRGVDPICTRSPVCDFHDLTVAEALAEKRPFALMVSSPRFCMSGICGPTLEILINEAAARPDVAIIHAEVYTDPDLLGERPRPELIAPTLTELGMAFEPSMLVVGADGIVRARLDASMDQVDIAAALDTALA